MLHPRMKGKWPLQISIKVSGCSTAIPPIRRWFDFTDEPTPRIREDAAARPETLSRNAKWCGSAGSYFLHVV